MALKHGFLIMATMALLSACQESEVGSAIAPETAAPDAQRVSNAQIPSWVNEIDSDTMIDRPKIVECTLSGGAKTKCVSFTLGPQPASFDIGPWCPRNISDGPDVSGLWLDGGQVFDADGQFIENLASFYEDENWQLFDPETGQINVTDTKLSCEAAARPDVDPAYQNHCVECQMSYLPDDTRMTYVIPVTPHLASTIMPRIDHAGVGVTLSGARLDAAAPLDAILSAYTIAAFDDCGGHINPNVGYHIHAVTDADCLVSMPVEADHAALIGVAMDGFAIHRRFNPDGKEPSDLDACRGHATQSIDYHYHANDPGANAILPCHTGQTGCALSEGGVCDASVSVRRGPPNGGRPPRPEPE